MEMLQQNRYCSTKRVSTLFCAIVLLAATLLSCCQNPVAPATTGVASSSRGAYILCEGLWRQDNATLARFDATSGTVVSDFFTQANPDLRIGDTANDMVLHGDTLYVAVSTSRTIEVIRASTGKWLGRIRFSGVRQEPRHIAILNDTTAFVTLLNDDSVQEFNPRTFALKGAPIQVGPSPEGIAITEKYIFVANSGFGDFRANEPKAGTISVVEVAGKREIALLRGMPNVREVLLSPDKRSLYATYTHLPAQKDSLGGIVEFDIEALLERRRWRVKEPLSITLRNDSLFCISARGVEAIPLKQTMPNLMLHQSLLIPAQTDNAWYSLAAHPSNGQLWIGNAKNFQTNGEVLIFQVQGSLQQRFEVGISPNTILFF
jgi:hypothetical protein